MAEKDDKGKKKDKGKKVAESIGKTMLPPSKLPSLAAGAGVQGPSYYFLPWKIFGHHSILQAAVDKKLKGTLRLEWTRGATTSKDKDILRDLHDNILFAWMTQAAIK
ncbi:hypothetical protein Dimus_013879, partial [Dionaea muscipula]